ncbi:hypothetical protein AAFF_G00363670 [Aldrovandia affinis]|uniref:Uncharacterized protein n=1 Tax=Aldrovandia affinis TaxID=143900 RepID=A0AAD7SHK4_9TELE|nr:hypothetical protein AAFF_G00363670 [Aldrovandia affinis]
MQGPASITGRGPVSESFDFAETPPRSCLAAGRTGLGGDGTRAAPGAAEARRHLRRVGGTEGPRAFESPQTSLSDISTGGRESRVAVELRLSSIVKSAPRNFEAVAGESPGVHISVQTPLFRAALHFDGAAVLNALATGHLRKGSRRAAVNSEMATGRGVEESAHAVYLVLCLRLPLPLPFAFKPASILIEELVLVNSPTPAFTTRAQASLL